jgi:hypothetical protein
MLQCKHKSTTLTVPPPIFCLLMMGALFPLVIFPLLQHRTRTRRCPIIYDEQGGPSCQPSSAATSSQNTVVRAGRPAARRACTMLAEMEDDRVPPKHGRVHGCRMSAKVVYLFMAAKDAGMTYREVAAFAQFSVIGTRWSHSWNYQFSFSFCI